MYFLCGNLTPKSNKADPRKIEAIKKIEPPGDVPSLKSFLGLVNYLSRLSPVLEALQYPVVSSVRKEQCL